MSTCPLIIPARAKRECDLFKMAHEVIMRHYSESLRKRIRIDIDQTCTMIKLVAPELTEDMAYTVKVMNRNWDDIYRELKHGAGEVLERLKYKAVEV